MKWNEVYYELRAAVVPEHGKRRVNISGGLAMGTEVLEQEQVRSIKSIFPHILRQLTRSYQIGPIPRFA